MSGIDFKVAFAQKGKGFAAVRERMPQAIANGLNEGGRLVFTRVRRGLREQTQPKAYSTITSRTFPMSATPGALVYTIVVKGKPIPIREFKVKRVASGVDGSPWGVSRVFERSFQEKTAGGGYIPNKFKARLTEEHMPIRSLLGPNLAKEMLGVTRNNPRMPRLFSEACVALVPPMLLKRLARAMGG